MTTRREPTLDEAVRILLWSAFLCAPSDYRSTNTRDAPTVEEGLKRGWWSVFPPGDLILDQVEDVAIAAREILDLYSNPRTVIPTSEGRWKTFVGDNHAATALAMLLDRKLLARDGDRIRVGIPYLVDPASPAPVTVPKPAAAPRPATRPSGQSVEKVTRPATVTEPEPASASEVIIPTPRADLTEKELRGIRIALEQLVVAQSSPRPTIVTPKGDSPVLDCARELAVLLCAFGTGTRNTLRERVRVKLRPFTSHALEFGVQQGAFVLVGSPVRGGEYSLVDPEPLDLSWSAVKGLAARKKPLRQLAGTRGT